MKEVDYGPDGRGPDSETVDIASLGLKSAADVHEYVRLNKLYEAYATFQVSRIKADGITHASGRYNQTGKTWFGRVQAAEDLQIIRFDKDANGKPVQGTEPYTLHCPAAKGTFFVRTEGYTIQHLDKKDQVFDKATNKKIWPQEKPGAAPKP
jgi:hypothetical protein